jgi:hypothetical protein
MMKFLRVVLPQETEAEKVFLGELLQSARWLGWEMPGQARSEALSEKVRKEQAGQFPPVSVHGEPA